MKKEYMKPQIEAIEINQRQLLLAGSDVTSVSGDVFTGDITGSKEPSRAPELDAFFNNLDF